ncbi:22144_t:CDS:2, partial [Gigaspora margarita]
MSLYKKFCNAYVYKLAVSIGNPSPNAQIIFANAQNEWKKKGYKSDLEESNKLSSTITEELLWFNASAQKSSLNPDLSMQFHSCVEFGSAIQKRKNEIIKVCTTLHLKTEIEERYKIYMSHSSIQVISVSRNEIKNHIDEYYCLLLVKYAQQFVTSFASYSVIMSQDDKAKVLLGVLAVGWTFKTIQSDNKPVAFSGYDFSKGTSSSMHIADILFLLKNPNLDQTLKIENEFKPILVLLVNGEVNGGPDKNPRYLKILKNISAYNSAERNSNLELYNFYYASEKLYDLWQRDDIHGHKVAVNYIDYKINPFDEAFDILWNWIDKYSQIFHYSLDIQ